jgi:hypothetical protein
MTNRRDVIKGGVAATTVFFGAGGAMAATAARAEGHAGAPPPGEPVHRINDVIFDSRFAPARVFGAAVESRGLPTHAFEGDVTAFWYRRLDPAWKKGPYTVAGMTGEGALFVLERLAWEKGMAVAFRARHVPNAKGGVDHRFEGVGRLISGAAQLDAGWAAAMAELVGQCPVTCGTTAVLSTTTDHREDWPGHEPLVSWIIAPGGRTAFPRT